MIKTFLFFIVLLSLAYLCFHSFFVVNERDQAAILGFGKVVGVRSQPGLYFKLPFAFLGADRIRRFEDRSLRLDLAEIRVQVAGGKFCRVNAFVIYKIRDPALFLQSVSGNVAVAEIRLLTRLDSGLREVYGRYGFEAALSSARRTMMTQVKSELEPQAWTLGLAIVDVRIERTDLTDPVLEKAFDRIEAKRFAVAERIRASDREAATRIRASANRQKIEIGSKARRLAESVRGEGDARRIEVFSNAHSRDPEFYSFYRSMAAYRRALSDRDTTLIVSPNNKFLRYFSESDPCSVFRPEREPPESAARTC